MTGHYRRFLILMVLSLAGQVLCQNSGVFDLDWFYMGSNLDSLGKPKFKLSQHSDGYSAEVALMGQSMSLNYTNNEQSVHYNMFDYSGNVKIQRNELLKQLGESCGSCYCPPTYNVGRCAPGLECKHNPQIPDAAGKCVTSESRTPRQYEAFDVREMAPRSWITIGPRTKFAAEADYQRNSPSHNYHGSGGSSMVTPKGNMKINIVPIEQYYSGFQATMDSVISGYFYYPIPGVRGATNIKTQLTIRLNPTNPTESMVDFKMDMKGTLYKEPRRNSKIWRPEYVPGRLVLSGSAKLIDVDTETRGKPNFKVQLVLKEEKRYKGSSIEEMAELNKNSADKNLTIYGMINWTGNGKRLAVLKVTDAISNQTLGRIQARRADAENIRLEVFANGKALGALNHQYNQNSSKYTIEDYQYCDIKDEDDINSHMNGLNDCVVEYRIYEDGLDGSDTGFQRCYQDLASFGGPRMYVEKLKQGGPFYEERWLVRNGYYEFSSLMSERPVFSDRITKSAKVKVSLTNEQDASKIELTTNNSRSSYYEKHENVNKLEVSIEPNRAQDYDFKLRYNDERIFDGFFYLTPKLQQLLSEVDDDNGNGNFNWNGNVTPNVPMLIKELFKRNRINYVEYVDFMSNV